MRKVLLLILPLLLFSSIDAFSQLLNGRVLNESGKNAANVTVQFQNKSNKISTNADGTFKIMAEKLPDTLVFSAPGFESYKVVITEKNIKDPNFEVVLLNKRKTLNEVVVNAMGASKTKSDFYSTSGSGSSDKLEGKVSGLEISDKRTEEELSESRSDFRVKGEKSAGAGKGSDKFFSTDTNIITRTGVLAKSRILTAGEINDFNKWKMWEDYTANEFNTLSVFWGMQSNHRYSVQVTGKDNIAITNEPVFLINERNKDTVWKAFTDNTGKAELWAGFFKEINAGENYCIADRYGNRINNLSEFENGVNVLAVNKSCNFSSDVDIAFVVDATGSMGDEIEFLKLELEDVIRSTMEKYKSLSLRAASVFYRDRRDEYLTKNIAFNDDLLKALNFIKLQNAGGGGDFPEAVDAALSTALDSLQWNSTARTKLLFLILDAPPHSNAKERMQQLIIKAAAMGIRIVPVACSGTDKSTEFLLRSMALATNGTYTFLTDNSGVGNSHIEPTTDKYEVELLNNLLQRIIGQFLYTRNCSYVETEQEEEQTEQQQQQPEIKRPENILSVKIYPNPTSGQFTIESNKDIREIFITDFTGKLLMRLSGMDKKGRWQVDISKYPSAVYLVKYITMDNKWGAEKVVLMRNSK